MDFILNKSQPICPQIYEQICVAVAKGEFTPNSKLFSVRELALKLGVNPNTVQKAYEALEKNNIIYSVKGSGCYISENIAGASNVLIDLVNKKTNMYFEEMAHLGYTKDDILKYLNEKAGENNE